MLQKIQHETFQKKLENRTGMKLQLKINDNRSTLLSVKWEPEFAKVSLHRMFLLAPRNVMQALAFYLNGEHKKLAANIKAFIEENLHKLNYSHELDSTKLETKGKFHNLQLIFAQLNREYFNQSLNLRITWFGNSKKKAQNRIVFGLYHDPLKLIKINRFMDQKHFPDYLIAYVVYHEMLHYVCPAFVDSNGQKHIHSKAFKELEKKFKFYDLAKQWIRDNQNHLFKSP
ncbi:MAG: hypothetical protein H0V82_08770 [Candidatus Protochlamydia sp.]|nr:hypothetical protein [Candidatus Protochlamydia sp.]